MEGHDTLHPARLRRFQHRYKPPCTRAMAASTHTRTTGSRGSELGGARGDTPPRREAALRVSLLYLQAATLPPVDWWDVYTIGANFSIADSSWNKRHARIDRAGGSDDGPREFAPARYPVATLLTIDNPLPTDAVIFRILQKVPVTESEANEDEVVRVLAGDRKVKWYDAWAAWLNAVQIGRHTPDAREVVLRYMKPTQIIIHRDTSTGS